MRGYEAGCDTLGKVVAGLRIPMRGYEPTSSHPSPALAAVTNPHEGL